MKLFTQLFTSLDQTTKTNHKIAALIQYFKIAPKKDAAWGLYFLLGNTLTRPASSRIMREWVAQSAGVPLWMLEECYHVVGDLAETFSLILKSDKSGTDLTLSELVENEFIPLSKLKENERKEKLLSIFTKFNQQQALVAMKLITGGFRSGVQKTIIARALSQIAGNSQAQLSHRLMGGFTPSEDSLNKLLDRQQSEKDPGQPYPFCLAYPLTLELTELGELSKWQIEWKWDGIRAQIIKREEDVLIWSRGEELISETFPDLSASFSVLPKGTVLDGEIVAWGENKPLPFGTLQKRLGRKKVSSKIIEEIPVHFLAYDVLEFEGEDIRNLSTTLRRQTLERCLIESQIPLVSISPLLKASSWQELFKLRSTSREMAAEGFMIKSAESIYEAGRKKNSWWKWKVDPHTCDAVLIYAQRGHGRRAGLFTDFTFAVWKGNELVPVAKAYSGLTDKEFAEINRFIKHNTIERFGPVVSVKPELVFELAFDDIGLSKRHKAGLALRFPRMSRIRSDKLPKDADSVETLLALAPSL